MNTLTDTEWHDWVDRFGSDPSPHNFGRLNTILRSNKHPAAGILPDMEKAHYGYKAYLHHVRGYTPEQAQLAATNSIRALNQGEPTPKFLDYLKALGSEEVARHVGSKIISTGPATVNPPSRPIRGLLG